MSFALRVDAVVDLPAALTAQMRLHSLSLQIDVAPMTGAEGNAGSL